ncbi:MAG: carbon-nitrogen hydrolase family protein [Asgard group archaeon]|nr:carbon-nitrogen hydrolase family protein [Asgard group archaeon]
MRIAMAITNPAYFKKRNLSEILDYIKIAGKQKADFILFPEAAYTGLIITDDPNKDKILFVKIPSKVTKTITKAAKKAGINVCIGLLELYENKFYDSAILIDRDGNITLKYQRISPGWHALDINNSEFYREGVEIPILKTEFGSVAILLCGDLFDEEIIKRVKHQEINYLFLLLARSLDRTGKEITSQWENELFEGYIPQIKKLRTTCFIVNYYSQTFIDETSIPVGGASIISSEGKLLASYPILKNGLFVYDLYD